MLPQEWPGHHKSQCDHGGGHESKATSRRQPRRRLHARRLGIAYLIALTVAWLGTLALLWASCFARHSPAGTAMPTVGARPTP